MVGELPNDFLRVMTAQQKQDQMTTDSQLARQIAQQEMSAYQHGSRSQAGPTYVDRLLISVVEVCFIFTFSKNFENHKNILFFLCRIYL